MRTIKDHARNAKCLMEYIPANVSGVVFSFAEWMKLACEMKMSMAERNAHPITRAYQIGLQSMFEDKDALYVETLNSLESLIESKEVEGI